MADRDETIVEMVDALLENVECESYEVPAVTMQSDDGFALVVTRKNIPMKLPSLLAEGFKVAQIGVVTIH